MTNRPRIPEFPWREACHIAISGNEDALAVVDALDSYHKAYRRLEHENADLQNKLEQLRKENSFLTQLIQEN